MLSFPSLFVVVNTRGSIEYLTVKSTFNVAISCAVVNFEHIFFLNYFQFDSNEKCV